MAYKFNNPHEWLNDFLGRDSTNLFSEATTLGALLDADQIQDEYQADMAEDGYFDPDEEVSA